MAKADLYPSGLIVVGANHRSSSAMLRDRLFVDDASTPEFLDGLRRAGIAQAIVLSTCDRVEVQAIHGGARDAEATVAKSLLARMGPEAPDPDGQIYELAGEQALHHIFSVAASLDSQVIGEPQVIGQVKASHKLAKHCGMAGPELESVLQAAYAAAKRVRRETSIGEGPVSMAAAAAALARDVHGDLSRRTALLMGGDMGELIAEHLLSGGLGRLLVTASIPGRAEAQARSFDCHVTPYDAVAETLAEVDIVLTSVGRRRYVVDRAMVEAAIKRRRRPLLLIDAAIPGDIDPEVNRVEEAFLYDLDELEKVALQGRATRESEASRAREIVAAEVAAFGRDRAERSAIPAVAMLRAHFEAAREAALREAGGDAERATRLLIGRLLHDPSAALRDLAARDGERELVEAENILKRLFRCGGKDKE